MDPFSLTTGIIALLGACATISRTFAKIRRLHQAPELIQAVNNEISDLQLILEDMSDHLERVRSRSWELPNADEAVFRLCNSILGRTKDKILEIDTLIQYRLLKEDNGRGIEVNKLAFIRYRDKLIEFQGELRESRQRVADVGRILEVRLISRLEIILDDIRSQDLSMLVQGQEKLGRKLDRLVDRRRTKSNLSRDLNQERGIRVSGNDSSSVRVSLSRLKPAVTSMKCTCARQASSTYLRAFLGTVFLGYTATPTMPQSKQLCPCRHQAEIRVAYYFPLWFLRYAFWLQVQFGMTGPSQWSLSFIPVIPQDHVALDMVRFGDIEGIKQLLRSDQLSIKAQLPNGASLLHVRL